MALPSDRQLCNGVPVDHRLKRFLPLTKQDNSHRVSKHAEIIKALGENMVRDNGTTPTKHEADFAAWLAKPDVTGGLVIALKQPAKSQVFTADVNWVRDECETLAYLDKALAFVNDPDGLETTSVFDAFPFITEQISSKGLSTEATRAYETFISMVEEKKPKVVFACWQIYGRKDLKLSGKGPGKTNHTDSLPLQNGHIVRVVNGFHPSYIANYYPNESCFRRLFAMELCKALCEVNTAWQEEDWMDDLRRKCRNKVNQLRPEKSKSGEQLNTEPSRQLRRTMAESNAQKYKAYTESFDNGLESIKHIYNHMESSVYTSQTSWDLYEFFVYNQNTSEGICDALLAVSEAMTQFEPENLRPAPALIDLRNHIIDQTLKFVKDDIPDLVHHQRGLNNNLWRDRYSASTSRGLKQSIEKITIRFMQRLTTSFPEGSKGRTYYPGLVHNAFKVLAVDFEDALGREYDDYQKTLAASPAKDLTSLMTCFEELVISSLKSATSSSDNCFNCGQTGHWSRACPHPKKGNITSKSPSNTVCYNCHIPGHWASSCPSPQMARITTRSRASSRFICYSCGKEGHFSKDCQQRRV